MEASRIFNAGYTAGLKQTLKAPNQNFLPGDVTKMWGVDKFISALPKIGSTVEYGEIVKITKSGDWGVTIDGLVSTDEAPQFAVVVKTYDALKNRDDEFAIRPLKNVPLTVWPIGLGATPEKDQNGEIVVVYSGADAVGTDLTGTVLYTPILASDTTGVNGTATKTATNNLALGLEAVGKVFAPTRSTSAKCIRVRVSGGKL